MAGHRTNHQTIPVGAPMTLPGARGSWGSPLDQLSEVFDTATQQAQAAAEQAQDAASQPIKDVQIRSQILPTIHYRPGGPKREPSALEKLVLKIVKPAITVEAAWKTYDFEPYGSPTRNLRWVLPTIGVLGVLGAFTATAYAARQF